MRRHDERGTRIGDGGAARFREQTEVVARLQRREQGANGVGRRVLVEFAEMERLQGQRVAHRLQVRACGLGTLDDEVLEAAGDCERFGGETGIGADRPERHRDQVERGHAD